MSADELAATDLRRPCDPDAFGFETTAELESLDHMLGQPRAVESVQFGVDVRHIGYNIFAMGPHGTGKRSLIQGLLEKQRAEEPTPDDLCYVNNFDAPHRPLALRLPAGEGRRLRRQVEELIEEAPRALARAFESDAYQQQRRAIEQQFQQRQQQIFEQVRERARQSGIEVSQTPNGIAFAPVKDGQPLTGEQIQQLPREERERFEQEARKIQQELQQHMREMPRLHRQAQQRIRELNESTAEEALEPIFHDLRDEHRDKLRVLHFLEDVKKDMIQHSDELLKIHHGDQQAHGGQGPAAAGLPVPNGRPGEHPLLRRYRVNVLVEHGPEDGAPIVYEDHPTYQNLIGRVEHVAQMGTLVSDFNLIRAGSLHRANGGYLMVDAHRLLAQPQAWDGLKRALRSGELRLESLGEALGLMSTDQLEPEPVALDVKVVLLGSQLLYALLSEYDPDFLELFKVPAEFAPDMERGEDNQQLYARLLATLARNHELAPLDREAVARVIEHASRVAGDGHKLSAHMRRICDLLVEADHAARKRGGDTVTAQDVQRAIDAHERRSDLLRERIQEQIGRGTVMIDTRGAVAGQINGLAVLGSGEFLFGRPNRITARVRLGRGEVVDIEREVALGGPIHAKGVLILSGFLSGRYARKRPLSLSATLVFEQSYSGVEGDSASSAELYALLSALADVPIRQGLAVTGSVNQHGAVQPIGGVNEKIEGFFDVCAADGLTGEQGVLIPAQNREHLMLRRDVADAVAEGRFHVYAVETIDEGIALLTGIDAGESDENGEFPADTVNGRVQRQIDAFAAQLRAYAGSGGDGRDDGARQ